MVAALLRARGGPHLDDRRPFARADQILEDLAGRPPASTGCPQRGQLARTAQNVRADSSAASYDPFREAFSESATRDRIQGMHTRKVQVKNGRLVLDEPTDLPDGAEVEVLVIDDEVTAEERTALHASLDRALDDSEAGRGMDAWEFLDRYRARREDRPAR